MVLSLYFTFYIFTAPNLHSIVLILFDTISNMLLSSFLEAWTDLH